ncbi:MAG: DegT/DnrJ/EryC1/StrS family aminotransferase, partial [Spirochaetia bacterium]|nr:DegT/DnrJ/EryC1/StrS family aminotransferase [Spirochaetia bacterium]
QLLKEKGLIVIEDFTGLVGSEIEGEFFGTKGNIAVCGLSEFDLLTTGNGGVIVCTDPKLHGKLQSMRYGGKRQENMPSFDYRLEDFQAAMGLDQISRLGVTLARRKKIGIKYIETLRMTKHLTFFKNPGVDAYLRFPVLINKNHEEVERYFSSLHIGVTRSVEAPLHHYMGHARLEYPNAERIFQKTVAIPVYPSLTANNVERIASSLRGLI